MNKIKQIIDDIIKIVEGHDCSYDCVDMDGNCIGTCKYRISQEIQDFLQKNKLI